MRKRRIRKVLVANRGEIALRVLRACRELGIASVAVYSEADRWANYAARADESYPLGGSSAAESYLRADRILSIAKRCGADAIHPGYGFLAENAGFADACEKAGIVFVGPPGRAIRSVGNKIAARKRAESAGIPVVPGLSVPVDRDLVLGFARTHGFPVLLKAATGGGGRGMRVVRRPKEVDGAIREASSEAESSFGDATLFVERYIEKPRHVEIQVLADGRGNVLHLGERECSIQRRHQKLVEESPSVAVDDSLRGKLGETAKAMTRAVGYRNAGTCEFLLEGKRYYFLEINTRLQVEHPVTEMVTGVDLVQEQLRIAAGEELPCRQTDLRLRGHAVECRICAEDPYANFAPSIGEVAAVRFPSGPFVRVDSDLRAHTPVTIFYDSMIAKIIAWAPDRPRALDRMLRALRETKIVGVATTLPFQIELFQDRRFRRGDVHTKFLEREIPPRADHAPEAVLLAAALDYRRRERSAPRYDGPRPLSPWVAQFRDNE